MQWINQAELRSWADRIGSREQFPVMIRDLILASVADIGDIHHIRFPGDEAGQSPGHDGELKIAVETPYIPRGLSVWEFGTNAKPAEKFRRDYETRVKGTARSARNSQTFVFATPRNWDNPKQTLPDFLRTYREKRDFADVRYIDGAMLDAWLQEYGAVGAKHARIVLGTIPTCGARSTAEFWDEFSHRYKQQLTEEVVLAGRSDQAKAIVDHLLSHQGPLVFVGDGPDEVSAVAVAAIRLADKAKRDFIEARTLIIDTDEAGRMLAKPDRYGYILSPTVKGVGDYLTSFGPTVSSLNYRPQGSGYSRLERPSIRDMSEALKSMSYSEEEAESLARKSGRSLTILHRLAPRSGFNRPLWTQDGEQLVPALLASAWDTQQQGDRDIIAQLSGSTYEDYERKLRAYIPLQDTPIDLRSGLWKLQAPVDAFVNLSHFITYHHLEVLGEVAIKVFTTETPPNVAEERFGRSKAPYSSLLSEGIATTLLVIAAMHEELGLEVGLDPEGFVNKVVSNLPGLRDDPRVILGLERQLTYLMEAAPHPLLEALEHLLEGNDATVFLLQKANGDAYSQIQNLLRALELLAWDPTLFRRAALLIAKLASAYPRGKSGKEPISSLRDLFTAWSPSTNAPLADRIAVIDEIISTDPYLGWNLVTTLLPKFQDVKGSTQRPRYRDAGASNKEPLTYDTIVETYDAMSARALLLVSNSNSNSRWIEVVEAFTRFSSERRAQFLAMLSSYAVRTVGEDRVDLRRTLRRLAERHARFRQAEWVLPEGELKRVQEIVASMESVDPFDQARVLFDEWSPNFSDDVTNSLDLVEQQRANAVARIAATFGAAGVIRLAGTVRSWRSIALAATQGITEETILDGLLAEGDPESPAPELPRAVAGFLRSQRGEAYDERIISLAKRLSWNALHTASMLLDWPEERRTWTLIATLGVEAEAYFWKNRRPCKFEGSVQDLEELLSRFIDAKRASSALSIVHPRESVLSWPIVIRILTGLLAQIGENKIHTNFDSFLLVNLFKSLRNRKDVDQLELARWEYAFFPVFEHEDADLALFDQMASDPKFFVSIMKDVFVADDANPDETDTTPEQRNRASISYSILIHNRHVPGEQNGKINQAELDAWIDGMNKEALTLKLTKVVPSYIGRTLAHATEADGVWPPPEVAKAIERLRSDDVEQSIIRERFNMRGVYKKSLFEGGGQERDLAARYAHHAVMNAKFPRTREMLISISRRWKQDSKIVDLNAERDRIRFE